MTIRLSLLLLLFTGLGCVKGGKPLSTQDKATLTSINTAQADMNDAVRTAYTPASQASSAGGISSRAKSVANELLASGCQQTDNNPPLNRFDMSWSGKLRVQGVSTCPLFLERDWSYDMAARSWSYQQNLTSQSTDFAQLSGLTAVVSHGAITAITDANGQITISGTITYDQLEFPSVGTLTGSIQTSQYYSSDSTNPSGSGTVSLTLNMGGDWTHTAQVAWDVQNPTPAYSVDGVSMDQTTFLGLFSSFGLVEIMENSMQMRYP